MIHLDTHVLVSLYLGLPDKLSAAARAAIEEHDLIASPAAVLELEFLHEIGRLTPPASKVVDTLDREIGLRICELTFRAVTNHALKEDWGRDHFDRLIVANAKAAGARLVTKDERIRRNFPHAIW